MSSTGFEIIDFVNRDHPRISPISRLFRWNGGEFVFKVGCETSKVGGVRAGCQAGQDANNSCGVFKGDGRMGHICVVGAARSVGCWTAMSVVEPALAFSSTR